VRCTHVLCQQVIVSMRTFVCQCELMRERLLLKMLRGLCEASQYVLMCYQRSLSVYMTAQYMLCTVIEGVSSLQQCHFVQATCHQCMQARTMPHHTNTTDTKCYSMSHNSQYWTGSTAARCNVIRSTSCISFTTVLLQRCHCHILPWAR
jgi:hypothetical protein